MTEDNPAESAATYRRAVELGLPYARTIQLAHMSAPWVHEAEAGAGAALIVALERAAVAAGVRTLNGVRVRSLTQDPTRSVVGAVASRHGEPVSLQAYAVVLASGGFTRNRQLIQTFGPERVQNIHPLTGQGSRGDGHIAAIALGAATSYMTMGILPTGPVDRETDKATLIFYCGGIVLNAAGERFFDESAGYTELSDAALDQPGDLMIHLYDQTARAAYAQTQWAAVNSLSGWTEISANTLDGLLRELADVCGMDEAAARKTVARYNRDIIDHGYDTAFGRRHLVGHAGALTAIETGPFYGAVTVPATTNYNGGLAINGRTQVVDVFGDAIPGLFAAGEIAGGFHGPGYMSGTQWGQSLIFGRRAGLEASATAVQKRSSSRDPRL